MRNCDSVVVRHQNGLGVLNMPMEKRGKVRRQVLSLDDCLVQLAVERWGFGKYVLN